MFYQNFNFMKNIFLLLFLGILIISCKKDAKIEENVNPVQDSASADSLTFSSEDRADAFRVEPISEKADLGKVIFSENDETIISFDTKANSGKIKLNGKEYVLDELIFSENNYEISGNEVSIRAENGNFKEMSSDCNYGIFPEVEIKLSNQEVKLANVKVQDCPDYN